MNKEQINDEADLLAKKERLEKLEKKYKFRTEAERLKPFFKIFVGLSFLLQILSALFAAGGVLLLSGKFAHSFGLIVVITIILLLIVESFKRLSYNEFNRQRNSTEKMSNTTILFCIAAASLSVSSSYINAPYTISFFSAPPELVDTSQINNNFKQQLAANIGYWAKLNNESKKAAKELKEDQTSSSGTTYWHALGTLTEMKAQQNGYKDSLVKYASVIQAANRLDINEAKTENKKRVKSSLSWVASFGSYSALASLGFEVTLFLLLLWCSNFEKREIKEAQTLTKGTVKSPLKTIKDKVKKVVKDTLETTPEASLVTNSMQFNQSKEESKEETKEPKEGEYKSQRVSKKKAVFGCL